jgi:hypothetical protein
MLDIPRDYDEMIRQRTSLRLPLDKDELNQLRRPTSNSEGNGNSSNSNNNNDSTHIFYSKPLEMRLVAITDACTQVVYGPLHQPCGTSLAAKRLPLMPSVSAVVAAFTLNEKQARAFTILAMTLLYHIVNLAADGQSDPRTIEFRASAASARAVVRAEHSRVMASSAGMADGQTFTYLGGGAGVGKSRTIAAVTCMAAKWGFEKAISVCAFTGIAASLLGARTLSSSLKFGFGMTRFKLTQADKDAMKPVCLLIIDECSMISLSMLAAIDRRLQEFRSSSLLFGGMSVCAVGDLLQLPPVNGYSLACQRTPWPIGASIWKTQLTGAAILTEVVRQVEGDPLHQVLGAIRRNDFESVLAQINARVIGTNGVVEPVEPTVEAYFRNDDRTRKNILCTFAAYQAGHTVYRFLMEFADQRKLLSLADMDRLRMQPEEDAGGHLGKLDLYVTGSAVISQNYCVSPDKIANGTPCVVWGFQFPDGANQRFADDKFVVRGVEACYKVPVDAAGHPVLPEYIFVQVEDAEFNFQGLPKDVYPIPVYTKQSIKFQVKLRDGSTKNMSTMVRQFGIVPAFARTFHKLQGCSLDRIIIGSFPSMQPAFCLYVALSRARTMAGVFLRNPITEEQARQCRFPADVVLEMARLELLESNPEQARKNMEAELAKYFDPISPIEQALASLASSARNRRRVATNMAASNME